MAARPLDDPSFPPSGPLEVTSVTNAESSTAHPWGRLRP